MRIVIDEDIPSELAPLFRAPGLVVQHVILCSQVRTISVQRIKAADVIAGGGVRYVTDATIRSQVRAALSHHLGLDIPGPADGAA